MGKEVKDAIEKVKTFAGTSMQEVVGSFVEEAANVTDSTLGYFAVMNKKEDTLVMIGWSMSAMKNCKMIDKPIVYPIEQTGLWGDAVRERKPVVTNDYKNLQKATKKGYPEGHVNVVRHFNIPIFEGNHITGVVGVGNKEDDYTDQNVSDLIKFADNLWNTIKKEIPNELLQ